MKKKIPILTLKSRSFICEQMAASNSIEPRLFLNPIFTTSTTTNSSTSLHIQNFKLKLPHFPTKNPTLVFTLNSSSGSATTNNNNDNTIITPYPDDPDPEPVSAVSSEIRTRDGRDRRKIVKVAWEKLVRWSRTWRSKAKTDILERTNKVKKFYVFISCTAMFRLLCLFLYNMGKFYTNDPWWVIVLFIYCQMFFFFFPLVGGGAWGRVIWYGNGSPCGK